MTISIGITNTTADNAVKSKKTDTERTDSIIKVSFGKTGLRHANEYLIFLKLES